MKKLPLKEVNNWAPTSKKLITLKNWNFIHE